jgi:hypothetical protein
MTLNIVWLLVPPKILCSILIGHSIANLIGHFQNHRSVPKSTTPLAQQPTCADLDLH